MGLRYRVPFPGLFYYSGRVGSGRRLPRGRHTGPGIFYPAMKWLVVYPSVAFFGVSLALLLAPFYGLFWVVRRSLRNRQRCQPVAQCFPVQRPLPQRPALRPGVRSYGFVPAGRPVQPFPYGSGWASGSALPLVLVEVDRGGVPEVRMVSSVLLALHPSMFWG